MRAVTRSRPDSSSWTPRPALCYSETEAGSSPGGVSSSQASTQQVLPPPQQTAVPPQVQMQPWQPVGKSALAPSTPRPPPRRGQDSEDACQPPSPKTVGQGVRPWRKDRGGSPRAPHPPPSPSAGTRSWAPPAHSAHSAHSTGGGGGSCTVSASTSTRARGPHTRSVSPNGYEGRCWLPHETTIFEDMHAHAHPLPAPVPAGSLSVQAPDSRQSVVSQPAGCSASQSAASSAMVRPEPQSTGASVTEAAADVASPQASPQASAQTQSTQSQTQMSPAPSQPSSLSPQQQAPSYMSATSPRPQALPRPQSLEGMSVTAFQSPRPPSSLTRLPSIEKLEMRGVISGAQMDSTGNIADGPRGSSVTIMTKAECDDGSATVPSGGARHTPRYGLGSTAACRTTAVSPTRTISDVMHPASSVASAMSSHCHGAQGSAGAPSGSPQSVTVRAPLGTPVPVRLTSSQTGHHGAHGAQAHAAQAAQAAQVQAVQGQAVDRQRSVPWTFRGYNVVQH